MGLLGPVLYQQYFEGTGQRLRSFAATLADLNARLGENEGATGDGRVSQNNLQRVLNRFGLSVWFISSFYKLYTHFLAKGMAMEMESIG